MKKLTSLLLSFMLTLVIGCQSSTPFPFPPAEPLTLWHSEEGQDSGVAHAEWAGWAPNIGQGGLYIQGERPSEKCPESTDTFNLPYRRAIVISYRTRALTDIQVRANGQLLWQVSDFDMEQQSRNRAEGFYSVQRDIFELPLENNKKIHEIDRVLINLNSKMATYSEMRPIYLELRAVSFSQAYTGTQHISESLLVKMDLCPEPNQPDFALSVSSLPSFKQSEQGHFSVSVQRNSEMTDSITLTLKTPHLMVYTCSPNPIGRNSSTSACTLNATSTNPGNHSLQVIATTGQGITKTATIYFKVLGSQTDQSGPLDDAFCGQTGDYVSPSTLLTGDISPNAVFQVTTTWDQSTKHLQLREIHGSRNRPIDAALNSIYGWSPHSWYFVVAETISSQSFRLRVFDLTSHDLGQVLTFQPSTAVYNVPIEGWGDGGWGFSPDDQDGSLLVAHLTNQVTTYVFLANLRGNDQYSHIDIISGNGAWLFSRCGDVLATLKTTNASLTFTFFRTRDFQSIVASQLSLDMYQSAVPFTAEGGSINLRITGQSGHVYERCLAADTNGIPCP